MSDELEPLRSSGGRIGFFQKADWRSFGVTAAITLAVYVYTMPPEVLVGDGGYFDVSSAYLGVPNVPGFPVWNVYSWLFTKLPFSNYAWRVALSVVVAGAITCGIVALLVSRVGSLLVESFLCFKAFDPKQLGQLRVVCGVVAGLGVAFDGYFWTWWDGTYFPMRLNQLLLMLTLCMLTRWFFAPQQRRYLYAAALLYGLTVCDGQSLISAAPGLAFMAAMADQKLGRDLFLALGTLLIIGLCSVTWGNAVALRLLFIGTAVFFGLGFVVLSILTHGYLSEWKAVVICLALVLTGLSCYFLLPVFSMMNPPMNWAYPRTVEGFFHALARGQYEQPYVTGSLARFTMQLGLYWKFATDGLGLLYILPAVIPCCILHKISSPTRRWLVGLLGFWLTLSVLMLAGLNPSSDKQSFELHAPYFSAPHLLLAVLSGCGLILAGAFLARPAGSIVTDPAPSPLPPDSPCPPHSAFAPPDQSAS